MQNVKEAAELVALLVGEIETTCPGRDVGRSTVQKMCHLLRSERLLDADFELFPGGPNSTQVEEALDECVRRGRLSVRMQGGRSIVSTCDGTGTVPSEAIGPALRYVREMAIHDDLDLAILSTAAYIRERDEIGVDDLIHRICSLNPRFGVVRTCSLLSPIGVPTRSW